MEVVDAYTLRLDVGDQVNPPVYCLSGYRLKEGPDVEKKAIALLKEYLTNQKKPTNIIVLAQSRENKNEKLCSLEFGRKKWANILIHNGLAVKEELPELNNVST